MCPISLDVPTNAIDTSLLTYAIRCICMTPNRGYECLQLQMKDNMVKLTLRGKKPTESLYAIRNVSLINDAKTCKHEELNVRGRTFNRVKG